MGGGWGGGGLTFQYMSSPVSSFLSATFADRSTLYVVTPVTAGLERTMCGSVRSSTTMVT